MRRARSKAEAANGAGRSNGRRHPEGKYLQGAPAIAIEVVSAEDRAEVLGRKTGLYLEHGAREVWRLYPKTRRITIHAGSPSQVWVETETVATPLLPGFSLALRV